MEQLKLSSEQVAALGKLAADYQSTTGSMLIEQHSSDIVADMTLVRYAAKIFSVSKSGKVTEL